ncbi:MAG: transglutaminase domain-containing protein, partial [Chloroflexi bacterium]|nr:transglutaminase domain-containing protein [Chloroflexota bacterium]
MQKSYQQSRDYLIMILLAAIIFTASVRLVATEWIADLYLVEIITFWGIILGFTLAYSSFKKIGITLLTLGYSIIAIIWQIIVTIDPQLLFAERLSQLSQRLNTARKLFLAEKPVDEPLIFILFMLLLFWSIAIYSSYTFIRKENALAAILPSTFAILAIQYYDNSFNSPLWMLGIYFLFTLLFIARLNYLNNKNRRLKEKVFLANDEKLDISIIVISTLTILILIAWNLPSTRAEWGEVSSWWKKTSYRFTNINESIENLFSAVDNPLPAVSKVFYGSELSLGRRTYQGNKELLLIHPVEIEKVPPRYYWRVRSYDTYVDGGWANSSDSEYTQYIKAETDFNPPLSTETTFVEFTFTNKADVRSTLITTQQPFWTDINVEALYTQGSDNAPDLNMLLAIPQLAGEESYTVRSALVSPTTTQLRAAGTEYPDWVKERYLQLPNDLPESLLDLSKQLSSGQSSPYNTARIITTYLRKEITYSEEIPSPPRGKDPIEWFLFTWKEGFCNYSASAEVILLRAAGIPARLVVGFAQGSRETNGDFTVLQKDAHAWPEVYFPEIGWVEFEPTLNQSLLIRPSGVADNEEELDDLLSLRNQLDENNDEDLSSAPEELLEEDISIPDFIVDDPEADRRQLAFWGMIVLLTGAGIFGIWYFSRKQVLVTRGVRLFIRFYEKNNLRPPKWLTRLRLWSEASPISRAFYGINTSLRWLGE